MKLTNPSGCSPAGTTQGNLEESPAPTIQPDRWSGGWSGGRRSGCFSRKLEADGTGVYCPLHLPVAKTTNTYNRATLKFGGPLDVLSETLLVPLVETPCPQDSTAQFLSISQRMGARMRAEVMIGLHVFCSSGVGKRFDRVFILSKAARVVSQRCCPSAKASDEQAIEICKAESMLMCLGCKFNLGLESKWT